MRTKTIFALVTVSLLAMLLLSGSAEGAVTGNVNKIFGIWDNFLPEPLDEPAVAALITFLIWLGIAVLITFIVIPFILPFIIKSNKEERAYMMKRIRKFLFALIMLYGMTVCVSAAGWKEASDAINIIMDIVLILIGAMIAWRMVAAMLNVAERRGTGRDMSVMPLVLMLSKIVIGMISAGAILAVMGIDLMIILTGAGVIGLAISFGAQSTLAHFFSGITLLATRPFRSGDLVRLDGGADVLRVISVGFMSTKFKNWSNSEIFTIPNQKVASSTIINMTGMSPSYGISVLVRVPYGTDIDLAKNIALDAISEHPRIVKDGSEDMPKARLDELSESSLTIRISGYVDDIDDRGSVAGEIRENIYRKYNENGLAIAVPAIDVRLRTDGPVNSLNDIQ